MNQKKFFKTLENSELERLKLLIENTDISKLWNNDSLDRTKEQIVKYIFYVAEWKLESLNEYKYKTSYSYNRDRLFWFLETNNVKTYKDWCTYEDTDQRANNLSIKNWMNDFNKNQDRANIFINHIWDYTSIEMDIRVYNDDTQTSFTEEFIYFAYLMDQMENSDEPLLNLDALYEIEEMDRIEYFEISMKEKFIKDITKHVVDMYPEVEDRLLEFLESKKDDTNYFYFVLRDAVEERNRVNQQYQSYYDFYEDPEGSYSGAFEIMAKWYLHEFFGCDSYPVLGFYPVQQCIDCGKEL